MTSKAKLFESLDSGLNCVGEPPPINNVQQPNMKTLLDASVTSSLPRYEDVAGPRAIDLDSTVRQSPVKNPGKSIGFYFKKWFILENNFEFANIMYVFLSHWKSHLYTIET